MIELTSTVEYNQIFSEFRNQIMLNRFEKCSELLCCLIHDQNVIAYLVSLNYKYFGAIIIDSCDQLNSSLTQNLITICAKYNKVRSVEFALSRVLPSHELLQLVVKAKLINLQKYNQTIENLINRCVCENDSITLDYLYSNNCKFTFKNIALIKSSQRNNIQSFCHRRFQK